MHRSSSPPAHSLSAIPQLVWVVLLAAGVCLGGLWGCGPAAVGSSSPATPQASSPDPGDRGAGPAGSTAIEELSGVWRVRRVGGRPVSDLDQSMYAFSSAAMAVPSNFPGAGYYTRVQQGRGRFVATKAHASEPSATAQWSIKGEDLTFGLQFGNTPPVRILLSRVDPSTAAAKDQMLGLAAFAGDRAEVGRLFGEAPSLAADRERLGEWLVTAAEGGHEAVARLLLERGADVDGAGKTRGKALSRAAWYGHEGVVRLLLEAGARPDLAEGEGAGALVAAAGAGHGRIVRLLLENGADVNAPGADRGTALAAAAAKGRLEIVRVLLERGADVGASPAGRWSVQGVTAAARAASGGHLPVLRLLFQHGAEAEADVALLAAASTGQVEVVSFLLGAGADPNTTCTHRASGYTPLLRAVSGGHLEVVKRLLDHGADVNAEETEHRDPHNALFNSAYKRNPELVRVLLDHGATLKQKDSGYTPLHAAIGSADVARMFLDLGVNVNAVDGDGASALHRATAREGADEEVVKLLVGNGADIKAQDKMGWTALMNVAREGRGDLVAFFIGMGADLESSNNMEATALCVAAQQFHLDVVQQLAAAGASVPQNALLYVTGVLGLTPHHKAGKPVESDEEVLRLVEFLIRNGADVNSTRFKRPVPRTALAAVADFGDVKLLNLLLESGADPNPPGVAPPLAAACRSRSAAAVDLLLQAGSDPNAAEEGGRTPLMIASRRGERDMVEALIRRGARLDATDHKGKTALFYTLESGRTETLRVLVERGADVNATDARNRHALFYALQDKKKIEFAQALLREDLELGTMKAADLRSLQAYAAELGDPEIQSLLEEKLR